VEPVPATHDETEAPIVSPRKVPTNHFISNLKKAAVWTIGAFDSRLFTDPTNPFIGACRRITGFPGLLALETAGINILPAPEKRSKQFYLGSGRGMICDRGALLMRNFRFPHRGLGFVTVIWADRVHAAIP
jgi:hypothetical protein